MTLFEKVIKGAWYSITDNKATRDMAKKRLEICRGTFHNRDFYASKMEMERYYQLQGRDYKIGCEHRTGSTCGLCGCVLKFKTRLTDEECPAQKW